MFAEDDARGLYLSPQRVTFLLAGGVGVNLPMPSAAGLKAAFTSKRRLPVGFQLANESLAFANRKSSGVVRSRTYQTT